MFRMRASQLRSVEQSDDPLRLIGELGKAHKNWPPIGERSFQECYLDARINLAVKPHGEAVQWGAIFQIARDERFGRVLSAVANNSDAPYPLTKPDKPLVLSHNVKVMKGGERVIPSIVWLETFDGRFVGGREPLYLFDSPLFKAGEVFSDGEIDIIWPYVAVSLGQGDGNKIQATSDHVNDRPDFSIDCQREEMVDLQLGDLLSRLNIWLSDDAIWATIAPRSNAPAERLDLGYGPINASLGW